MATRDLAVRFTTQGFDDLRKQLSSAGKSFDEALKKAKDASQQAIADARHAAGDTQALEEAQKAFERAARQANNAVAGSFRELRIKSTADIEAQKVAAISAYEAIEKSGTASAQDIANAKAALKRTLEALDDQLDQTNGKVGRLGEGFTILKGVLANLISSGIQAGLSAIANTIQSLIQGVIGFGKASVGAFMSFDGAMKAFAAKSGGATEEQIRAVREETEKLGMATSKTPTQIAQMAASLAGAGFSAQETKDALGGIVMASEATGESLETVGDIVGAAINQFRLNAADSGYIADVLTAGANASATSISGLGEGLKYIGAIAGGANQNIEDMTIVLGLLTNAGLEAGQAGRNFASAFERIANASAGISDGTNEGTAALKAQQKALQTLGVQFRQADGQMRPFLEVLPELAEQYNKLSFGDQDLIRKQLFGTEGGRALVALLSQVETKLGSVTDAVRNSAGAAGDASEQLMKGLGPAIELLQSSMEVLQKNLGEAIAPAFEFLVRATTGWVNELIKTEGILDPIKNLSEEIKGFFEQNPAIIETINREMSALVQDALNAAVDLAQQLFGFLKENPTAIADLIRKTAEFVGGALKTTVNLAQTLLNYFRENQGTIGKMGDALGAVWRILSTINNLMGTYMRPIINWAFTMIQGLAMMLTDIVDKIGMAINAVKSAWNWAQGRGFQSGGQQPGSNATGGGQFTGTFGQKTIMSLAEQRGLKAHHGAGNHFGSIRTGGKNPNSLHRSGNAVDFGDNMQGVPQREAHKKFSALVKELMENGMVAHVDEIIWNGHGSPLGDYFATGGKGPFFKIANGQKVPLTNMGVVKGHTDHLHIGERTRGGDPYSPNQTAIASNAGGLQSLKSNNKIQSYVVTDLSTGQQLAQKNSTVAPASPASTVKLIVADVIKEEVKKGKLSLNTQLTINPGEVAQGSSLKAGQKMTVQSLITAMLKDSDNTATNKLINYFGGTGGFTNYARDAGYKNTTVRNLLSVPGAKGFTNTSTAADVTRAAQRLLTGNDAVSKTASSALRQTRNFGYTGESGGKIGNNSRVIGNVGIVNVGGKEYLVTAYANINGNQASNRGLIKDFTNQVSQAISTPSQTAIASSAMTSGGGVSAGGAAPKLTPTERQDLIKMMAAEATGEGVIGKAAVGRAILNRSALIASGVAPKGTGGYGAKSASVSDVIRGKNARGNWEFSPMGDGRFNKQYDAKVMAEAEQAFNLLLDDVALKGLGLSDATINSPNFQNVALRKPGWWQGQSTQVKHHHFGRDKFSATRNVSELVAKTFTTESGVSPATNVSFTQPGGAAVNPMATQAENEAAKAENELEKQREQSRQNALKRREQQQKIEDQEAIAVLRDRHETELEELKRSGANEFVTREQQAKQTLELRKLETNQAIAQLKKERATIEAERAKKLKTPVEQQTPEQKVADYSAEIKMVDLQIQQQEKSLKRTTDKITREFSYIAEDQAKSVAQKQIDEYVRLGNEEINRESRTLDESQAKNEISQTELTYRRAVLEASRKQLEIDRLNREFLEGVIKPDDIDLTLQKIEVLKEELKSTKAIAEINYERAKSEQEIQSQSQVNQFDLDTQKRRLEIAEQTGQISQADLIVEKAKLDIAGKQLEQQHAIAALELGVTPEQKQVLELRIKTINDEIQQTQILTEYQLEQLEIQREQLAYQADYEQITRMIEIAEREGNFERVETLKLLQSQYDLETKIAEIKKLGLRPDQEAQAIAAETRLYELNKEEIIKGNRDMGESFRELLNGPFSEFFQGAVDGTRTLSDAFNTMAKSILGSLSRVGAELATNSLLNMLGLGKPQQMQGLGGAIAGMFRGEVERPTMATVGGGMFGDGIGLAESAVAGFAGVLPANNITFAPSVVNSPQAFTGMVQPPITIASEEVTQALSVLTETTSESSDSITRKFTQSILDSTTTQTATTAEFVTSLQIARNAVISFAQSLPGGPTVAAGNSGGNILGTLAKGAVGALTGGIGGFTAGNAAAGLSTANAVASGSFGGFASLPVFKYGGEVEKLSTVQTFKEGGEVKEIATYKDGGMVEKLLPVPTFANGGKVDPLRTAIASAFKKEGSGALLAVMHGGEHVLSDRQGEAQTYRTLEKHFGKNPLSKISLPAFKYGGEVKEIATYKDGGMVKKLSAFIPSYRDGDKISIPTFMNGGAVGSVESRLLSGLNSTRMASISLPTENRRSPVTAGPVSNTVNVNINDRESRFYRQSRTLARDLADQLRS